MRKNPPPIPAVSFKKLYVGIDESNYGQLPTPEVCVAAMSNLEEDLKTGWFKKPRGSSKTLFDRLGNRKYTCLLAFDYDYSRVPQPNFLGTMVASLLQDDLSSDLDELKIILDGVKNPVHVDYTLGLISERSAIERKKIKILSGADFDRKYPLVNLADGVAYHLFIRKILQGVTFGIKNQKRWIQ